MTTELLMGNEAIARGALEAGVGAATGYPGTPSSEIVETLAKAAGEHNVYVEWSINEKVALEVAAAASFTGLRSLCAMKQNGVNVASDFLVHVALSGVRGGLVLVSCDDPGAYSSMNEEDSRYFARVCEIPLLEPGNFQQAKDLTKWAFELSETLKLPVMVRSVGRLSHGSENVTLGRVQRPSRVIQGEGRVVCAPVVQNHAIQQEKLKKAAEIFEKSPFNTYVGPEKCDLLIITCGVCTLYSKEAVHALGLENVGILNLATTWPVPASLVRKYLPRTRDVLFVEEILPFCEENVKACAAGLGRMGGTFHGKDVLPSAGELGPDRVMEALSHVLGIPHTTPCHDVRIPERELTFCPGCPHRASFYSIHTALSLYNRKGIVCGDIGCYTLDLFSKYSTLHTVHAMGSGVGIASGLGSFSHPGAEEPVLAVCGDSTFFHAAIPALINAVHHKSRLVLIILDNEGTAMTGFQPHPGLPTTAVGEGTPVDIATVCKAIGANVETRDPFDITGTQKTLLEMIKNRDVNVLILSQMCALKKERGYTISVNEGKCLGEECGCNAFCTRVFACPALVWDRERGKATVDESLCNGCGACVSICPAQALERVIQ